MPRGVSLPAPTMETGRPASSHRYIRRPRCAIQRSINASAFRGAAGTASAPRVDQGPDRRRLGRGGQDLVVRRGAQAGQHDGTRSAGRSGHRDESWRVVGEVGVRADGVAQAQQQVVLRLPRGQKLAGGGEEVVDRVVSVHAELHEPSVAQAMSG